MAIVVLDLTRNQHPSFADFLASRIPIGFLNAVRPLIEASYDAAFKGIPVPEGSLPYLNNLVPHNRNCLVFEHLHELAVSMGLTPKALSLDNGYFYLEIESKGLSVHIKHENKYQTLKEQMVKADYRRQMTTINLPFGQLPLFSNGKPMAVPDQAYAIMFYKESAAKPNEVGEIYFILPSNEEGNILASSQIEEVIACSVPGVQGEKKAADDDIDLPSKRENDEEEQAQ